MLSVFNCTWTSDWPNWTCWATTVYL